jgi:hypothetical protein
MEGAYGCLGANTKATIVASTSRIRSRFYCFSTASFRAGETDQVRVPQTPFRQVISLSIPSRVQEFLPSPQRHQTGLPIKCI